MCYVGAEFVAVYTRESISQELIKLDRNHKSSEVVISFTVMLHSSNSARFIHAHIHVNISTNSGADMRQLWGYICVYKYHNSIL